MRRCTSLAVLILIFLGIGGHAQAESEVQVEYIQVTHTFGDQLNVEGKIETETQILDFRLVIQSEDDSTIADDSIALTPENEFYYSLDLTRRPIRAFSELSIWFEVELEGSNQLSTEKFTYYYHDNRFDWQSLYADEFHIFWYEGDEALGGSISNAAFEGLGHILSLVEVPHPEGIEIYAYASAQELQDVLFFSGQSASWIAGHADPDLGVIVVSLPPGQDQAFEIKRQVPHELAHVLLYQKLGHGYANLPRWLNEGLASMAELFPNPDYQYLLDKAFERETLIPIKDLCHSFPNEATNFQLSYAESTAFTRYLQRTYGKEKIEALLRAYADGQECEQGAESVFGVSLTELEMDWRKAMFNEQTTPIAWMDAIPILIVAGMAFITPVGLMVFGNGKKRRFRK